VKKLTPRTTRAGRRAPRRDEFAELVLDQLARFGTVEARPMFGGFGLYGRGPIFGIIHRRRLYFRVSDATRPEYEARGTAPFRPYAGQAMPTYHEVPLEILEDAVALVAWARAAEAAPRDTRPRGGLTRGSPRQRGESAPPGSGRPPARRAARRATPGARPR
jgi:DNA transformation protein